MSLSLAYKTEIFVLLDDASDEKFIKNLIVDNKVNTIIHAVAYKHVPLVEQNCISGMYKKFISTDVVCRLAYKYGVNNFSFISKDKAVRPNNMGASKRFGELIVIAYAEKIDEASFSKDQKTIFSMVRFGNVLGSSGSLVPLFKN